MVWENVAAILEQTIMVPATSVQETWKKSWIKVKQQGAMSYKKWRARFVALRAVQIADLWIGHCPMQEEGSNNGIREV